MYWHILKISLIFDTKHPYPDSDCHGNMPVVSVEGKGEEAGQCGPCVCWSWKHVLVMTGIHAVYLPYVLPGVKKTPVSIKTYNHCSYSQVATGGERGDQSLSSNSADTEPRNSAGTLQPHCPLTVSPCQVITWQEDCKSRVNPHYKVNYYQYLQNIQTIQIIPILKSLIQYSMCICTGTGIRTGTAGAGCTCGGIFSAKFDSVFEGHVYIKKKFEYEKMKIKYTLHPSVGLEITNFVKNGISTVFPYKLFLMRVGTGSTCGGVHLAKFGKFLGGTRVH